MRTAIILAVGMHDFSESPNIEDPRVVVEFEASPNSRWAAGDYAIFTLPELAARDASMVKQGHEQAAEAHCVYCRDKKHWAKARNETDIGFVHHDLSNPERFVMCFAAEIRALSPAVPALEEVRRETRRNAERLAIGNAAARWLEEYGTVESVDSEVVYDWLRALIGKEG